MKFSVAPESRRAGASVLLCAAWTYARKFIDFLFDMYILSDVFLCHAVRVRRVSTSSLWEVGFSLSSVCPSAALSASSEGESGVSPGRSKVTVLGDCIDSLAIAFSRLIRRSDSSFIGLLGSRKVLLFVGLLSNVKGEATRDSCDFSKYFVQRGVGCPSPHSAHRSLCLMRRFRALASLFIGKPSHGIWMGDFRVLASISKEESSFGVWVRGSVSRLVRFFKAWASFFIDLSE